MRLVPLLLCALLLPVASALTASPAQHTLYAPDGDSHYSIAVRNDEQRTLDITFTSTGPFAASVEAPSAITLAPGEQRSVPVLVRVPGSLGPGVAEGGLLIESRSEGSGVVSASSAVLHSITLIVPREGTYLDGEIIASASSVGEPTTVTLVLRNIGTQTVIADAELFAGEERIGVQSVTLEPGALRNVAASWTPQTLGEHTIRARASYGGKELALENKLVVGDLAVAMGDISFGEFVLGRPFRVALDVQNSWGQPLPVVAEVSILQNGTAVRGESAAIPVSAGAAASLPVFLESSALQEGAAQLQAKVSYAGRQETRTVPIVVKDDSIAFGEPQVLPEDSWLVLLVLGLAACVIFITWRFSSRRKGR